MSELVRTLRDSGKLPKYGAVESNPFALTNDYTFIDADTIKSKSDPTFTGRLKGIDAPEVAKFFSPTDTEGSTAGGYRAGASLMELAQKQGFTNVVRTGELDAFDRELVELRDDRGRDFTDTLMRTGVMEPTRYSTAQHIKYADMAKIFGVADLGEDFDIARNAIADTIAEETQHHMVFRDLATTEQQLAYGGGYYMPGSVALRDPKRTLQNKAKNPLSEAWDIGWVGAYEGLSGFLEMAGESTGIKWAEELGEASVYRQQRYLGNKPEIVTSFKDVDGIFGKQGAFQYLLNNAVISVPYMGATAAGYLAAGPTMGASMLLPVSLYTGTIYNDQPEDGKNAGLAIAGGVTQSVLDRLGLQLLIRGGAGTMLTKKGRDEIIEAYAKKANVSPDEAKRVVLNTTRKEMAKLAKDAAAFAKQQISARNVSRNLIKRMVIGGIGEGTTEFMQEAVGYTAAHAGNGFKDWDANEFNTRLIDGAIAGTAIGKAFTIPGTMWDYGLWRDVQYKLSPSTGKQVSEAGVLAKEDIDKHGKQFSIQQNNAKLKEAIDTANQRVRTLTKSISGLEKKLKLAKDKNKREQLKSDIDRQREKLEEAQSLLKFEDINDRSARHEKALEKRTVTEFRNDLWNNLPALWRGMVRHIFPWDLQLAADNTVEQVKKNKSLIGDVPAIRHLAEAHSGNLEKSMTGMHYENRMHHYISALREKLKDVNTTLFAFGRTDTRKSRLKFSEEFYDAFLKARENAKKKGRPDNIKWDEDLEGPFREQLPEFKALVARMEKVANDIFNMQKKHNPFLGKIAYFLARSRTLDKEKVARDRGTFEKLLSKHFGYSDKKARELTTAILTMDSTDGFVDTGMIDYDGNFSVTSKRTFRPKAQKKRELGISDIPDFKEFLENDLFTNMSNNLKSAVRYTTIEEFVGSNNEKINYWLDKAERQLIKSGKTEAEAKALVDQIAFRMKRYYDAQSGNYKRTHKPVWEFVKKNLIFVTTVTQLPLATVSNIVELGTSLRGLSKDQIFGTKDELKNGKLKEGQRGSINAIVYTFVEEFVNTVVRGYSTVAMKPMLDRRTSYGYQRNKELGFMGFEVGAAHTTGVSEVGHLRQRILDMYFKVIGLQQWTNAMRAGRAAIAADYILDKVATIAEHRTAKIQEKDPIWTNEMDEAQEALRNLGIDPNFMVKFVIDKEMQLNKSHVNTFKSNMREGEFNFVNEAVVLPQSANRPLIFQDPRFALFTQFQGFISTFTAWHLPKMWRDLVRRGTPGMKYNAFATAMSMIALGFLSQHLKDLLKFGEPSPYFTGMEYMRRGVGASGLLGTGERLIDFAFPMYDKRYPNTTMWAIGTVAGESAAVSKALRLGGISYDVAVGDKPTETLYKLSPFSQTLYKHLHPDNVSWDYDRFPDEAINQ
tara:strand:+ start:4795 stop:8988 length:4194 start_codon:yes stop_codon:yes gene_type:complete